MQAQRYFGSYARFDTKTKREAAILLGADNLVGDVFDIVFERENGISVAWMKNRFGALIGFFDEDLTHQLSVLSARGWKLQALLSFVAYTDDPAPGFYWGQAAIICYDTEVEQAFDIFVEGVSKRLADGTRPAIDLGEQGVNQVVEHKGAWQPKKTLSLPQEQDRTVIMKSQQKMSEKLIEQSRKGNKGCYVASWAFLLVLVALIIFGLKSCGVF